MDVKLVIEQGKTRARAIHLRRAEGVIGRERGCAVRIPSAEVSRQHCVLRVRDGYVTVKDLQSSNGTQLNGEDVKGEQVVRPGDRLRVGPVTFIVEYQLTPEAIDRLLHGDVSSGSVDMEVVEEDGAESEEVASGGPLLDILEEAEAEPEPEEQAEAVEELELADAAEFQLPETEELRDILTGLDSVDEEPPPPKKRKKK
jgi:predicted component of type VI protein secretion system